MAFDWAYALDIRKFRVEIEFHSPEMKRKKRKIELNYYYIPQIKNVVCYNRMGNQFDGLIV